MNRYIEEMRRALVEFYNTQKRINAERADAMKKYNQEFQGDVLSRLMEESGTAYDKARYRIESAKADALASIEAWEKLDGSKLTDDAKLLKYDLPPSQFYELAKKYKNNGTMCLVLAQYAEKKNREKESPDYFGWIDTSLIPTRKSLEEAYQYFYNNAITRLGSLYDGNQTPYITFEMMENGTKNFGAECPANIQYFNVLPNS